RGHTTDYLRARASLDQRRQLLFDEYIRQAFERRPAGRYSPQQSRHWLAWLARAMAERSQSIFYVEGLQPDLLSARAQRLYAGGVGFAVGLVASLCATIANLFSLIVRFGPEMAREWLGMLLLAAAAAPAAGAILGMLLGGVKHRHGDSQKRWLNIVRHTAWLAPTLALAYGLTGWVSVGFAQSLPVWPVLTLIGLIVTFLGHPDEIVAVERYKWSWAYTRTRLPLICGLAICGGTLYWIASTPLHGFLFASAGIVVLSLALGLSAGEIEARTRPNQGIWFSARSAAEVTVVIGCVALVSVALLFNWFAGPMEGSVQGVGAATIAALLGCLLFGGLACIQHYVLRLLLWRAGTMPLNDVQFLDQAADLMLLRKVGGGYIFLHRLLLEHFAGMEVQDAVKKQWDDQSTA
ncbi:MAG TPA: hypothetical protein VFX76_08870, partial [Roseiflexaceae bacterium]|nr:hypothetical protein [Roseiflexaceae bacterium]